MPTPIHEESVPYTSRAEFDADMAIAYPMASASTSVMTETRAIGEHVVAEWNHLTHSGKIYVLDELSNAKLGAYHKAAMHDTLGGKKNRTAGMSKAIIRLSGANKPLIKEGEGIVKPEAVPATDGKAQELAEAVKFPEENIDQGVSMLKRRPDVVCIQGAMEFFDVDYRSHLAGGQGRLGEFVRAVCKRLGISLEDFRGSKLVRDYPLNKPADTYAFRGPVDLFREELEKAYPGVSIEPVPQRGGGSEFIAKFSGKVVGNAGRVAGKKIIAGNWIKLPVSLMKESPSLVTLGEQGMKESPNAATCLLEAIELLGEATAKNLGTAALAKILKEAEVPVDIVDSAYAGCDADICHYFVTVEAGDLFGVVGIRLMAMEDDISVLSFDTDASSVSEDKAAAVNAMEAAAKKPLVEGRVRADAALITSLDESVWTLTQSEKDEVAKNKKDAAVHADFEALKKLKAERKAFDASAKAVSGKRLPAADRHPINEKYNKIIQDLIEKWEKVGEGMGFEYFSPIPQVNDGKYIQWTSPWALSLKAQLEVEKAQLEWAKEIAFAKGAKL